MRPNPLHVLPLLLLLAADPGLAASRTDGPRDGYPGDMDGGSPSGPGPGPGSFDSGIENAKQRLGRVKENFSRVQGMLQNAPESGPALQTVRNLILTAEDNLAAGRAQVVFDLCGQIDHRIGDLYSQAKREPRGDKARIEFDLQRESERLGTFSRRLEGGRNPCAAEMMEKVRGLLANAKQELNADRLPSSQAYLTQAKALTPELQRLTQENSNSDRHAGSAPLPSPCKEQPTTQAALARASEGYRRVLDRFTRITEQSGKAGDPKSAALKVRVQEILDKAKEALATGQADAAKELCAKAEGLLPELNRASVSLGEEKLSSAAWLRLKAKLDKAAEIVSASGNDKAARILEKGQEHFERAERDHAEGRTGRAEVEMDIALKLAAKAVDIARASAR